MALSRTAKSVSSKPRVFVGMSGGVDSSVTAALLQKRGFNVRGVHIKMWGDPEIPCTSKEDRLDAMRAAAHLRIPFETWDLTKEYKQAVVEYMIAEYRAGRTPNPDVMCNREIKFGVFLRRALAEGADFVATGHYVRLEPEFTIYNLQFSKEKRKSLRNSLIENSLKIVNCKLKIAKDLNKDQSYFLWALMQKQLRHVLFPIGEYTKPEVRAMAKKLGLPNADKPDSQGICFIGQINIQKFLKKYIPLRHGAVVTTAGRVVGEHEGLSFYTIGQRHGIEIGGGIPYYVAAKDQKTNTLVVVEGPYDEKLFSSELTVSGVNWISGNAPEFPLACEARIRYRQQVQKCRIKKFNKFKSLKVVFDEPQRAITPGQSIVFYKGDEMLGGGVINV
ncbi:MAG: tRNA 2-thiouridine(34) synthase MnmA [Candidatus Sungbacteria bacterium]|nr:tRNA 2-thiouridine(34) synthase MnmA [Candidatus Sungbacteria bacterium]